MKHIFLLLLLLPGLLFAQTDSVQFAADSTEYAEVVVDTQAVYHAKELSDLRSALLTNKKVLLNDFEVPQNSENGIVIFTIILLLLLLLTYLKLAYSNDFNDVFRSVWNANISSQIFRSQTGNFNVTSFLLLFIFVVGTSIFTREVWLHFSPTPFLQSKFSIAAFTFLFTSFCFAKYVVMKITGALFDVMEYVDEYIFHLNTMLKTLAIIMVPALLLLFVAKEKVFVIVVAVTLLAMMVFAALAVTRGLSTAYKLMYKSVYHFLLYVCLQEILPVFLFIKLLTKTAT
ncbi:MAG: DUF4271 domain-containing protein [Chitinophagales bacterium]